MASNDAQFWEDSFNKIKKEMEIRDRTNMLLRIKVRRLTEENDILRGNAKPKFLEKVVRFVNQERIHHV